MNLRSAVTDRSRDEHGVQSTTNLLSPSAWVTNSAAPVVIAGQNTVTNPLTGAQKFYRLIK